VSGLLQDECEGYEGQRLSKWFASRIDARQVLRNNFKGNEMKTYSATVMISFAVEVEVEADNEDDARQLLDEKAWESYFKTTGESELYDFMEVRP